ncbi:MAG: HD-GYP domain-containing protein [Spirochaetaceae bacterium]|nr:MAG: HD-GYP domain-containing protein [Spirochaetaceae bacterium]
MKTIKVSTLRPGMKFDQPVFIEGDNVLVPAGVEIKDKDIERLSRWDIEEVYTDGQEVKETSVEAASRLKETPVWLPKKEEKSRRIYRSAVDKVDAIFQDIADGTYLNHEPIDSIVKEMLDVLRQNKNEMIQLILLGEWIERRLSVSAINCMIISAVIGATMRLASHRLLQLATGALLHDVGMLKVEKEILEKQGRLSNEELNRIRTHPVLGYQIISKDMKYPEEIALIALQHHEHWDGRGYPRSLKGEDITLFARVVTVADAYEAMVSERPYRNSIIGYNAMKTVLSDNGRHFDPQVLKAFLESMGIFPIGSVVQLNNSSIGRVSENHADAPLRPKIELLIDEFGNQIEGAEQVDLLAKKNLFIVKAIDPKQIGEE